MTSIQVRTLLTNIVGGLGTAGDLAGTLDPAIIPLVVIGKAVLGQVPDLGQHVTAWINGDPPTDAELDALASKLATLADPNLP